MLMELKYGRTDCGAERVERHLPTSEEHLRPNQTYNLNKVQSILGQDCYDIHQPLEFKKSEGKASPLAGTTKIGWALSGLLPAKQEATLATTATSIADDKMQTKGLSVGTSSPTSEIMMSTDIRKRNNKQSKCWSK